MGHGQILQVAVWAVCLASTGGAFAEPPPGSEAPTEYGEAEVETVIVIGDNYRCPDDEPPEGTTVTYFRSALESAGGQYSSDWHWAALAPIHEYLHVDDFIRFDSCAPWETSAGQAAMRDAGYTEGDFNQAGFEEWVRVRSWAEYRNVFGVRAPEDPEYISGKHNKPLSCLFAQ